MWGSGGAIPTCQCGTADADLPLDLLRAHTAAGPWGCAGCHPSMWHRWTILFENGIRWFPNGSGARLLSTVWYQQAGCCTRWNLTALKRRNSKGELRWRSLAVTQLLLKMFAVHSYLQSEQRCPLWNATNVLFPKVPPSWMCCLDSELPFIKTSAVPFQGTFFFFQEEKDFLVMECLGTTQWDHCKLRHL